MHYPESPKVSVCERDIEIERESVTKIMSEDTANIPTAQFFDLCYRQRKIEKLKKFFLHWSSSDFLLKQNF